MQTTRREFVTSTAAVVAGSILGSTPSLCAAETESDADKAVKALYESLTSAQRRVMCFDWDKRGDYGGFPLRLHVTNNWAVSPMAVESLSGDQQSLVQNVFESVLEPDWTEKLHQQAKDDTGRTWTQDRRIAIFGTPGSGRCQCVISGFHLTFRAGDERPSTAAFGGAICHGHQPSGFHEKPGHPGNIFWYQAQLAHQLYQVLDGRQRKRSLVLEGMPYYEFSGKIDRSPILPQSKFDHALEPDVRFRGKQIEDSPGLPIADLTRDQRQAMEKMLAGMLAPYRQRYRDEVTKCLTKQSGLEACHLIFYKERTLGKEGEWDNWRIEGPAFVWYFRGFPHVHLWIHVADDPTVSVTSHFG